MAKKSPVTFIADDGKEFDSKEAAERHEALIKARNDYQHAREIYKRALHESQKTADGVPFEYTSLRDYWYVSEIGYFPRLCSVDFYVWNCDIDDEDELRIHVNDEFGKRKESHRISELYADKRNAERKLYLLQCDRLQELTAGVNQLKHRINFQDH